MKVFLTIRFVKLVNNKKFATAIFDLKYKIFVVYKLSFTNFILHTNSNIYSLYRPQIAGLIAKKNSIIVFIENIDFANVFSFHLIFKFPKYIGINNHAIKLVNSQQPLYRPIYILKLMELEILKAYIEINLNNGFFK